MKRFFILLTAVLMGLAMLNPSILSFGIRYGLGFLCASRGMEFHADSVRAGIASPLVIEGLSIIQKNPKFTRQFLTIERLEILWNGPLDLYSNPRDLIRKVTLTHLDCLIDPRRTEGLESSNSLPMDTPAVLLAFLVEESQTPECLTLEKSRVEFMGEDSRCVIEGLSLGLNELEPGYLNLTGLDIQVGRFKKFLGPLAADTSWGQGSARLGNIQIQPDIFIEEISLSSNAVRAPSISFKSQIYGGALRGDIQIQDSPVGWVWDIAAIASNVTVDELPAIFDLPGKAQGRLSEGRVTFRGNVNRPADAEASLHIRASDFRWNDRGWETLDMAASLIHRRLMVTNFDLQQKENKVTLNGEISLEEGWSKIMVSPFLVNIRANMKELGELTGLLGVPLDETSGQLTAEGSLSGRDAELDGFIGIQATDVAYRKLVLNQMKVDMVFRKKVVDLVLCEIHAGKDVISAKGTAQLAAPHSYTAELNANLTNLASYLRPFNEQGADFIYGGALGILWRGEGTATGHTGSYDLKLSRFTSQFTPAGLTGRFAGTYSPENISLSTFEVENEKLRLSSLASITSAGATFKDIQLSSHSKPLLKGAAFVPIDPFAIGKNSDWFASILEQKNIYLQAETPNEIDLQDLIRLVGQKSTLRGFVKMRAEAFGPASNCKADAHLALRDLSFESLSPGSHSSMELNFKTLAGTATMDAVFKKEGCGPVQGEAKFPIALKKNKNGKFTIVDPDAAIEAWVDFPQIDLATLRPFLPGLRGLSGSLSGNLKVSNTFANPSLNGSTNLIQAGFYLGSIPSRIEKINAQATIDGDTLRIDKCVGEVAPGRFEISGACQFPQSWQPKWDLTLQGSKIPLQMNSSGAVFTNMRLRSSGDLINSVLSGNIAFVESQIHDDLHLTPLFSAEPQPSLYMEFLAALLPAYLSPSAQGTLDLSVSTAEPIRMGMLPLTGELACDLKLRGSLKAPVPSGRVTLSNMPVHLPAGRLLMNQGTMDFLSEEPWNPILMAKASGWLAQHFVEASAFGKFSEGRWLLRSPDGFLSPQDLTLLLEIGALPYPDESANPLGLASNFRAYVSQSSWHKLFDLGWGDAVFFTSLQHPRTQWGSDRPFSDSLNFATDSTVLPLKAFDLGFEWDFR